MNSLQRMTAAIHGRPFDRYPFVNPYPFWSMMPHWPEMLGKTFLHVDYGSDDERLQCYRALHGILGLDWLPVGLGSGRRDDRYKIDIDGGTPVLIDLNTGARERFDEFPMDAPITERRYKSVREVEALPDPPSTDEILAGDLAFTRKVIAEFGNEVFMYVSYNSPFSECFRALTFTGLYEAVITQPALLHAILERHTEKIIQHARAAAKIGIHGAHVNEYPCGAELLSNELYLEFVYPYERRIFKSMRDAGLVTILEYLGWVEPRLPHIAELEIDCLQTESSLKGYENRVEEYRRALGEEVCIFSNSPIYDVIERGDEQIWRCDALAQAKGIGKQQRFVVCAGSPTTWATGPGRLRRYGEFMQETLAEINPPRGSAGMVLS